MKIEKIKKRLDDLFNISQLYIIENGKHISVSSLAFPTLLQHILLSVIGTINTAMISGYAENAVGATTAASQVVTLACTVTAMITVGTNVMVNIELGRGDRKAAARYAGASLILSSLLGMCISIIFVCFSTEILEFMNITDDALSYGSSYLRIYGGALVLQVISNSLTSLLICYGHTMKTMAKSIAATLIGVLFGYLFLKIDLIPEIDGTVAIALGNVISFVFNLAITCLLLLKARIPISLDINYHTVLRILKVGVPGGASGISYMLAQTITTSFMADIGILSLNTKSYVGSIVQYTYFVSAALATGVQIMMGRYAGRGDSSSMKKLASSSLKIAVLSNGICSLAVLIFHRPLLGIFTDNPDVLALASLIFVIDIFVEIIRAVNHVMESSLNASRDVCVTLTASILSCWFGSVFLSYLFGIRLGMGLSGCWLAFAIDELIKATIYVIRWRSGRWRQKLGISEN